MKRMISLIPIAATLSLAFWRAAGLAAPASEKYADAIATLNKASGSAYFLHDCYGEFLTA